MTSTAGQASRPRELQAYGWAARIERVSELVPSVLLSRSVSYGQGIATRHRLLPTDLGAYQDLFTDPETGASLLGFEPHGRERVRSSAEVVLLGALRAGRGRSRAFYLTGRRPVTVAIYDRLVARHQRTVRRAAQVQARVHGRLPVEVPEVLDVGTVVDDRLGTVDFVAESALPGRPVSAARDTTTVVPQLLAALTELWQLEPPTTVQMEGRVCQRGLEALVDLADNGQGFGLWPSDVDAPRVRAAVTRLMKRPVTRSVGLSHGDPGLGNVLRRPDGGLALLDWEDARSRHFTHDVLKVLLTAGVPVDQWDSCLPDIPSGSPPADPPEHQLAATLVQLLVGWRQRRAIARRRGTHAMTALRRETHDLVTALDHLLR